MRILLPVAVIMLLGLAGCATTDDPTKDWAAEKLYSEAKQALEEGNYPTAIQYYEKIEARYPYGAYAEQAQLDIAYAYFKHEEMASAIAAANRFIRLHPTHPNVDYAYYIKGLAAFDAERNFLERWVGASDLTDRDPKLLRDAYEAFRELVERFPNSRYTADSRQRMVYLLDAMAKSEMHAARYYYGRGAYVAAVNRTKFVIENYSRAPEVEHALGYQALSYKQLGLDDLMQDTLKVLETNFPKSPYLAQVDKLKVTLR